MNHPLPTPRHLLLLAALALPACDAGDPLRPAAFEPLSPEAQSATVGSPVPVPPGVRVVTSDGRAVPGVEVVFTVAGGGGTVAGAQVVSDASGAARVTSWTLGTQAGPNTLTVSSPKLRNVAATLTAVATADAPAGLAVQVQPSALAASGAPLAAQPVVRVVDRFGNSTATAGLRVTAAADGGITVTGDTATTDATGTARFTGLTLSGPTGSYALRFAAPGLAPAAAASATIVAAGAAHHLALAVHPPGTAFRGLRLDPAPVVSLVDQHGNSATMPPVTVTVSVEGSGGTLLGTTSVAAQNGSAVFGDLVFPDSGTYRLRFAAADLGDVLSDSIRVLPPGALTCAAAGRPWLALEFELGKTVRYQAHEATTPRCLEFDAATAAGQQYLVMFENMPLRGDTALFPGAGSAAPFMVAVQSQPAGAPAAQAAIRAFPNVLAAPPRRHQWDFGDGPIYEGHVEAPPGGVPAPRLRSAAGLVPLSSAMAHPAVGDTIEVYLAGISRLSIPNGTQRAVVRLISDHLIIAEDVRLPTLVRQGGGTNRFLLPAELDSIAAQYALHASVQGNLLFEGRHNSAVESWGTPPRVLAVHTLMYADNVWGYTWPNMHYFAFDYWVASDGITKGYSQNATRVADNLFMHEVAHMRHFGLSERAGVSMAARGNTWLVEGFARATERLPIAMRLLGTATPSRLDNLVLPRNVEAFGNAYFFDDVPTYLQAGAGMFAGYGASAYVFDYFADQVALAGGDPLAALREFVVYGGDENTLNQVIARWLGEPVTFPELFTRARIALYADDYGPGLPARTQYLQYQLRASRPPGTQSASDPRNAWIRLSPGLPEAVPAVTLPLGTARGVLVDGAVAAVANARILIDASGVPNGVISITRVR